jgi:hypothetical protein
VPGLVESFGATIGWRVCACNVIVEGTSDVKLMWLAASLYFEKHKIPILGDRIAILAAGKGDEGGVDGVNRKLNAARQLADADRASDGSLRYRFVGLYDNDRAGRRAIESACRFDRRLLQYADLFLLCPVMPLAAGADHAILRRRFETENAPFEGLDWEVEDLLSSRLLADFERSKPGAVLSVNKCGGRVHRELTRDGKYQLHQFVKEAARLEDVIEVVRLLRALRDYFRLEVDHIIC